MTVRQGQASGSVVAAGSVTNGAQAGIDRFSAFSWEEWFSHASPHQRSEALGLARQQGLLYPHQLPATSNGVKPAICAKETETSLLLARLLAGKVESLPRSTLESLSFFDAALDDLQQHAVVRAISTPDVFMLQGLPGTGKSRVLAEVILQAAARGQRVLFLATHAISLDVVLERLVGRPEVFPLRFLEPAEKPEGLPAWLRGFTLEEQKKTFLERTLAGTRGNHEEIEAACRRRSQNEPLWTELHAAVPCHTDLAQRLQKLQVDSSRLDDRAGATATNDLPKLTELRQSLEESLASLNAALRVQEDVQAQCDQESDALSARIKALEPGYEAKKHGRFWTPAFWMHLFNGRIIRDMDALRDQQTEVEARRQEIIHEIGRIKNRQTVRQAQFNDEQAALLDSEFQTRKHGLQVQQEALDEEHRQLDAQWNSLCQRLDVCPSNKTIEAVNVAHQAWLAAKRQIDVQCHFAQQWSAFVEQTGPQLAARLPGVANVLAGTISRWHADAKFRDAVSAPVDLLIVEDAETLTEADLLKLGRQAQRIVLIGQTLAETASVRPVAEKPPRSVLGATVAPANCWNRLWSVLDGDPGRWPHTWRREQGRLICQLMPLLADDHQHLESEGLADASDIELRILHRPRTRPCLAQVIFPPHGTFAEAFTFMVREVQEFPLEPFGRTGWWSEDAEGWTWRLGPTAAGIDVWVEIEAGLRLGTVAEERGGDATRVACIQFARSAGWERAKAENWLLRHRQAHDHERTVFLQTPHRFERPLAKIVQALVRSREWLTATLPEAKNSVAAFEFVAVPELGKPEWPREGAGLELDLSGPRQADRLPTGLRQGLPPRGFVNYLEAQALIRRLETWMQKEAGGRGQRVAVLALYAGQVELLRRLVEQSELLRSRTFPLEVALPSRLHQRECDVVFLSLTRSHAHRCVAFAEDIRELPLAVTRARSRLFVFADPGSLCKRTQWQGPLDQLDVHASQQEQIPLSRLLAFLQNHRAAPGLANGKTV